MSVLGKDKNRYAAEVRNRAMQKQLEFKVTQLEKEKQRELRMFNIERQKFKSKYSKSSNEAPEVTMYQTHYPGFYYTSAGELRNSPTKEDQSATAVHFEHIRSLIFTEDEVDLEKIICLHLLCVHKAESLTPPRSKARCMCREHSPCERLIERSKKGFTNFERLSKLLPLYAIDLTRYEQSMGEQTSPLINDGRLASRILINEKLMALINTVVTTLEKANKEKFWQLLTLGNSRCKMRRLLETAHIAEFADFLLDHPLLHSCDAFVLTPPFKIKVQCLEIKTSQGNLEHLVSHFRQNILQQPTMPMDEGQKEEAEKEYEPPKATASIIPLPKIEQRKSSEISVRSSKTSAKVDLKRNRRSVDDRLVGRHMRVNFVARNKEDASRTKRIDYDVEDDLIPRKRSSTGKMKIIEPIIPIKNASMPAVEENESDEEKFIESVESNKSNKPESETPSNEEKPKRIPIWEQREPKNQIKQTTCPACMERYKMPLPTPKTPSVKRSNVLPEMYANTLRTNSQHRISIMINNAMYNLESYDRRYSPENEYSRRTSPKQEVEDEAMDNVYLNPVDLMKIKHEINNKEAEKKVEKFVDRYSNNDNE
ncbi:uncharacterized protein LOC111691485 [Anoplophora glabripennis]|uniref:uncharacterized protein LOC111691485 n=1 Tax=Anoplophora glabripennis TaxID=217634 RepID=UPI000C75F7C0|nr:uncharacterized protein LOC111691485 [Anoplophora glabripennis]